MIDYIQISYLTFFIAYLLGSLPTAFIVGKLVGKFDIRTKGSKTAGATNVYRLLGLKPYLFVLFVDMLKGYLAVSLVAKMALPTFSLINSELISLLAVVLGHIFPIFVKFRGGKGVATAYGGFLALVPIPALIIILIYFVIAFSTKYISLGSLSAGIALPFVILFVDQESPAIVIVMASVLAAIIVITHIKNIRRLLNNEEQKTDFFAKSKPSQD
ncbi:MAG: glycerol-3-phosphate 1-O-acyltransferase PlsY [Nitrospinota bacterium]